MNIAVTNKHLIIDEVEDNHNWILVPNKVQSKDMINHILEELVTVDYLAIDSGCHYFYVGWILPST